ncbi:MAG: very short patch repair endonuclease [Pirellulales bacterium]
MPRDIVTAAKRREMMQAVRRSGTDIELIVRRAVFALGHRGRANAPSLQGRPDLANQRAKWAIFVHGCFWHGHRNCRTTKGGPQGRIPVRNGGFWEAKIASNRERDARKAKELRRLGFRVLTLWECDVRDAARLGRKLERFLGLPG